jgi:hypothetical protein
MRRTALELMHFRNLDEAITAADSALLEDEPDAQCVKGCYRRLLSYYNQPDHELIDRTDDDFRRTLLRLARSEVAPVKSSFGPLPDSEPLVIDGTVLPLAWRAHLAAAAFEPVEDAARAALEARGFAVVTVPDAWTTVR